MLWHARLANDFCFKNESLLRKRYEHERDYNPFFLTKEEKQRLKY